MRGSGCFAFRCPVSPPALIRPAAAPPHLPAGEKADPIRTLLGRLVGREVVLQVGSVRRKGRVASPEPLLLVDDCGRTSLIRPEAVAAVEF